MGDQKKQQVSSCRPRNLKRLRARGQDRKDGCGKVIRDRQQALGRENGLRLIQKTKETSVCPTTKRLEACGTTWADFFMCRIPLGNARPFQVSALALEAMDECYTYSVVMNLACQSPKVLRVQPTADSADEKSALACTDVVNRWQSFLREIVFCFCIYCIVATPFPWSGTDGHCRMVRRRDQGDRG